MALVKNFNSYATVAEADTFFADRLDVAAWTSASEAQKAQALVTATSMLDGLEWAGTVMSDSQSLAFPRTGTYFDPRLGKEASLLDASAFVRLITALYELAYHLLNNDGLLDDTGSVENMVIGNIQLQNISSAKKIPSVVTRYIKPLLLNKSSRMWWRAN